MGRDRVRGCSILALISLILTVCGAEGQVHHRLHTASGQLREETDISSIRKVRSNNAQNNAQRTYIAKGVSILDSNGNACVVKLKCLASKMSEDIEAVNLIYSPEPTGTKQGDVKAHYSPKGKFHVLMESWNKGVLNTDNLPDDCTAAGKCDDAFTYLISPMRDRYVGEYKCQMLFMNSSNLDDSYLSTTIVNYSDCCPRCSDCKSQPGIWDQLGKWTAVNNNSRKQRREAMRCLTKTCSEPRPFETRTCFQDGTCDADDNIRIITSEIDGNCQAVVRCGTMGMCGHNIRSVKLFHQPLSQTGRGVLKAQALSGISQGRFLPNDDDLSPVPGKDSLCAGLERCYEKFTYVINPLNATSRGRYTCVITELQSSGTSRERSRNATLVMPPNCNAKLSLAPMLSRCFQPPCAWYRGNSAILRSCMTTVLTFVNIPLLLLNPK